MRISIEYNKPTSRQSAPLFPGKERRKEVLQKLRGYSLDELNKGEVPPGCLLAEPVTLVTRFFMPLEPSFGTMLLSSALS